jgi:hypothetical protein
MICAHRWGHPDPTSGEELHRVLWTTRSFILIPKDSELHTFSASKLFACLYPEAVTLAPVIASPEWRRRAAGDDRELGQFVTEVRRRLRDSEYQPRGEQDPIAHWIESDCWRSPATPSTNFAKAPGWRASNLPDCGPNRVRFGKESRSWHENTRNTSPSSVTR